jgi:putative SOS response-associated peptidase YedK
LRNKQRPFAFAGIRNSHRDENGIEVTSFAIITTTANKLLQEFGYKRMPVILYPEYESGWLKSSSHLSDVLNMLSPFPENYMNAYPISNRIVNTSLNDISLIQPIGRKVLTKTISKSGKIDFRKEVITDNNVVTALVDKMNMSKN